MAKCDECDYKDQAEKFEYMNTACYECKHNPNRWDNFKPRVVKC